MSKSISIVTISTIQNFWISFSLTLGNMDSTSRVGNISSCPSICSMDSRDGSRGNTMNSNSVSNIRNSITNSMVNRGSIAYSMMNRGSITNSMVDWGSIADSTMNRGSITKTIITISTIQSLWFSFSLTLGNMDGTSRVGNISTCSSISSMDSRDGSRGNTMDSNSVSNIGNSITNSMVNRGSIT